MTGAPDTFDHAPERRVPGDPMAVLSLAIGVQRRSLGLTQDDLAREVGVHQPRIAEIEVGRANPRLAFVLAVLQALDLDLLAVGPGGTSSIHDAVGFGEAVRASRTARGLSQSAAALAMDRKQPYVARIEAGDTYQDIRATVAIASAIGIRLAIGGVEASATGAQRPADLTLVPG